MTVLVRTKPAESDLRRLPPLLQLRSQMHGRDGGQAPSMVVGDGVGQDGWVRRGVSVYGIFHKCLSARVKIACARVILLVALYMWVREDCDPLAAIEVHGHLAQFDIGVALLIACLEQRRLDYCRGTLTGLCSLLAARCMCARRGH